jgi:hypothetical protein
MELRVRVHSFIIERRRRRSLLQPACTLRLAIFNFPGAATCTMCTNSFASGMDTAHDIGKLLESRPQLEGVCKNDEVK